jgi:cytoskeletal protein RodZ
MGILSRFSRDDPSAAKFEDEFDLSTAALKRCQSVSALLRRVREGLGRDVEQIGAALHIRASHLQAIEDGNYEELPGRAYAIGFIRSYAEYLGLDGPEMVRRFKEIEGQELKNDLSFPMPVSEWSVPSRTILLGGLIIALCGYGIWHYISSDNHGRTERVAAVPSALLAPPTESAISPAPDATEAVGSVAASPMRPVAAPTPKTAPPTPIQARSESAVSRAVELAHAQPQTPAPASPAPPQGMPPPAPSSAATSSLPALEPAAGPPVDLGHVFGVTDGARYRIALRATDDTWLEVKDGGTSIFRRLMRARDEYRLADKPGLTMRIGNTKGIEVTIDGKPLPSPVAADLLRRGVVNLDAKELLARAGAQ